MSGIFGPFLTMALLTFAVWAYMYFLRIRFMLAAKVHPQSVTTPEKMAAIVPEAVSNPANNLKNLFELPVLFYAMCLYLYVSDGVDTIYLVAAWLFVGFRILHSFVHCTSNAVMTRFRFYVASSCALWFMILRALMHSVI
ncbi:MAG: hypothetical protein HKN77_06365 [Woeseiaceae bacterium]|nr:hypothetical protein [Woeseiaceae bacterium]